jgi:hypothetical protein
MKTIWTVLAVIAVANMLALLGLVGWLQSSDRLDMTRVAEVRRLFVETTAERRSREDEEKAKAEAEQKTAAERAKEGQPPLTAGDALALRLEQSKLDHERMQALRREVQLLQETLRRERSQLDAERAALQKDKNEFEQAREAVAKTEGNAQFKKALATLEGLKPDKAKTALQQLLDQKQADQVVAYLNAMQERIRTKVIDEFIKSDPKVATDLLERLRTRGLLARGPERPLPDVPSP